MVGKYVQLTDSYKSIIEAITHASTHFGVKVDLKLINSEEIVENNLCEKFNKIHGVIVAQALAKEALREKYFQYITAEKIIFLFLEFV